MLLLLLFGLVFKLKYFDMFLLLLFVQVCDICGYRSRDNTTYYLHYHKYFKHGVKLPKGWSVYKCDLCGKELYTKFQLKVQVLPRSICLRNHSHN